MIKPRYVHISVAQISAIYVRLISELMSSKSNVARMKRPAADEKVQLVKRPAMKKTPKQREWVVPPGGPDLPQWPRHWLNVLYDLFDGLVINTLTSETTLTVWSDCGGMSTEMGALADIAAAIEARYGVRIRHKLFCFCDSDEQCREMAIANHAPTHVSDDIYSRNFDDGTFECSLHEVTHAMPPRGLDLYVCCFPCGPWSKNGKRLGFHDGDGHICYQAIASIKYMKPSLYLMENVVAIGDRDELGASDLDDIKTDMAQKLPDYVHLVITGIDPTVSGFPSRKNRTVLVGGRSEVIALRNSQGTSYSE